MAEQAPLPATPAQGLAAAVSSVKKVLFGDDALSNLSKVELFAAAKEMIGAVDHPQVKNPRKYAIGGRPGGTMDGREVLRRLEGQKPAEMTAHLLMAADEHLLPLPRRDVPPAQLAYLLTHAVPVDTLVPEESDSELYEDDEDDANEEEESVSLDESSEDVRVVRKSGKKRKEKKKEKGTKSTVSFAPKNASSAETHTLLGDLLNEMKSLRGEVELLKQTSGKGSGKGGGFLLEGENLDPERWEPLDEAARHHVKAYMQTWAEPATRSLSTETPKPQSREAGAILKVLWVALSAVGRCMTPEEATAAFVEMSKLMVTRLAVLRRGLGPKKEGGWPAAEALERTMAEQTVVPDFLLLAEQATDRRAGITKGGQKDKKVKKSDSRFRSAGGSSDSE